MMAIRQVLAENMTVEAISKKYGIPRTTLRDNIERDRRGVQRDDVLETEIPSGSKCAGNRIRVYLLAIETNYAGMLGTGKCGNPTLRNNYIYQRYPLP